MSPVRSTVLFLLGILLALPALSGCGGGAGKYPVKGAVTFDGTPVKEGRITFLASDAKASNASADIKDGNFSTECEPGTYKVEITASRVVPGKFVTNIEEGKKEKVEMFIPAQYNTKSTLTKEVTKGKNEFQFDLTSKK
jgi:hypothetical protein